MRTLFTILVAGGLLALPAAAAAGELNPPGAPAPTPGFEARTPITALPVTIDQPGSHYLTGDLEHTGGTNGITILSGNVTIDLNGFSLIGSPGPVNAIAVSPEGVPLLEGIEIRGGVIRDWGGSGVNAVFSSGPLLQDLQVSGGQIGIVAGQGAVISGCTVQGADVFGIAVLESSTIISSTALLNDGQGIAASNGSVVKSCTASMNGGNGFRIGDNCVVLNCVAIDNGRLGTGLGFDVDDGALIRGCTANRNADGGIEISEDCRVIGNVCGENDNDGDGIGAGILASGSDNRIEGNHCSLNVRGIDVQSSPNFVIRNSATESTGVGLPSANFNLSVALNTVGPIETGVGIITSTSPWANFEF